MRTALLALALSPTLAVVPCSSDKPDDVDTEGCYGWCSAAFAADHCGWCRCKGCNFCRSSQPSLAPVGEAESTCASDVEGDAAHADCQTFCSPQFASDHCARARRSRPPTRACA